MLPDPYLQQSRLRRPLHRVPLKQTTGETPAGKWKVRHTIVQAQNDLRRHKAIRVERPDGRSPCSIQVSISECQDLRPGRHVPFHYGSTRKDKSEVLEHFLGIPWLPANHVAKPWP